MTRPNAYDVAIVGAGPAGLSAALLLGRCRRRVVVFDHGQPRNKMARSINGYLGLDGISPSAFRAAGRVQAEHVGVEFVDAEVVDVEIHDESQRSFQLTEVNGEVYRARKVLLATGVKDKLPEIAGITDFYGTSVHHCPYCDGWEHRGEHLVAVGEGKDGASLALSLRTWSPRVTACSNGSTISEKQHERLRSAGIGHNGLSIDRLEGDEGRLKRMVFVDGSVLECDALFFSDTQYQCSKLAEKLGCTRDDQGHIESNKKQRSSIPGLFVTGDADGFVQFAIVAAAEGAIAATAINEELQKSDLAEK